MSWTSATELALVVLLGTAGQIFLKSGLRQGAASAAGKRCLLNAPMIAWLWCYAGSTLLWLIALRTIPLSQAFPILGLQYALIPLVSGRLLGEPMSPGQRIGIIIIVIGVGLVGQS